MTDIVERLRTLSTTQAHCGGPVNLIFDPLRLEAAAEIKRLRAAIKHHASARADAIAGCENAVLAEREACAKIADTFAMECAAAATEAMLKPVSLSGATAKYIAAAIRARGRT